MSTLIISTISYSQTSVTFKPGPAVGEDATIWQMDGKCKPTGLPQTPALINWGNNKEMALTAWTWRDAGCAQGTQRSLIRFKDLNTLIVPNYITQIVSAKLRLFTPNPAMEGYGNNYYPGTPLPNPNPGWIQRVLPGNNVATSPNNWTENTVTWNTQPAVDVNSLILYVIPSTNARFGFTQEVDVTNITQQIVNELFYDPYANNGFKLSLQDEIYYRSQIYASSDNANSNLWPELVVTYNLILRKSAPIEDLQVIQMPTQDDPTKEVSSNRQDIKPSDTKVNIVPNPTVSGWNINIPSTKEATVTVNVYDSSGKKINTDIHHLNSGVNTLYLSAEKLVSGIYFIEVKGSGINVNEKAIKR